MAMKLYGYFRSSASYRVRIALNLKGVDAQQVPVNLREGEQKAAGYQGINPQGLLPSLQHDGHILTQSLAIMEYLEECFPEPAILPDDPSERARVRALSQVIASDISPLNNLGVLKYLKDDLNVTDEQKDAWYRHWIEKGFSALESLLANSEHTGNFCHWDSPTMADCCLVPQVFNARRFGCPLEAYPTILRIDAICAQHPAFAKAHPSEQQDAI